VGDDFVYDTTDLNESASRIEVFTFGERVGLKAKDITTLRTSSVVSLPWDRETLEWWLVLSALGLVSYGFARGALVLVARRPALAGTAIAIAVVIAIPPVSWSGGGGGPVFYWELSDPLGTGMVLLDEDDARIRHKTFKPFGGDYASVGTLQSWNVSYAGHRRHDDTGLYFMQARWMDPNAGTFLSIDPLVPNAYDPQTVNPFAYARNNPINWIDPDGQAACGPLGIACFGLNPSEIANWLGSGFSDLAAINLDFYSKELAYENRKSLIVAKQAAAAEATRDAALEAEIANRTGQEPARQVNQGSQIEDPAQAAAREAMIPLVEKGSSTDTEYAGYLLREGDKVIAGEPVAGPPGSGSVSLPLPPANAVGQYGTQGALGPTSEAPSVSDHASAQGKAAYAYERHGTQVWRSFVGTPGNRFWVINVERRRGLSSSERLIGPLDPSRPLEPVP